jgi:uncharacterized protein (DUF433 family)
MTIKWVKVDPLVLNGEPFLYNSRLTVRQLLEMRASGQAPTDILKDHPELRVIGIAAAFGFAADHRDRYDEFFEPDGSLSGPGFGPEEVAALPEALRRPGIVVKAVVSA